jgi:hypothetical protein
MRALLATVAAAVLRGVGAAAVSTSQDLQVISNFLNSGAFENMLLLKTIREINATLTRRRRCSKPRTTIPHSTVALPRRLRR